MPVTLLLATPRGFCAGVERAIAIVEAALLKWGAPIYVRHDVVHNRFVVDRLKAEGVIFVEDLCEIPDGAVVIFSAHGVSQAVRTEAYQRSFRQILDATCPLVTKVHVEVMRQSRKHKECVLIGHRGHPEVEGTLGQYQSTEGAIYLIETKEEVRELSVKDPTQLFYVTQTTLSVTETEHIIAALKQKFPLIQGPRQEDICYATQNRQEAIIQLAEQTEVVLVVGSNNSSNTNRLCELVMQLGKPVYRVEDHKALCWQWFEGIERIGITAGASAPEILVQEIVRCLVAHWPEVVVQTLPGLEEHTVFSIPKLLQTGSEEGFK